MRPIAGLLLAMMAIVVVASAWLRLAGTPPPDCESWPSCRFDRQAVARIDESTPPAVGVLRAVHRVAASIALAAIVALLASAWRARDRQARRMGVALLLLALGLSLLGIATPGSRAAAVMLGNLLGGALMFALAWVTWKLSGGADPMPAPLRRAAAVVALPWLAQVSLGALSGAGAGVVATLLHLLLALLLSVAVFALAMSTRRAGRDGDSRKLLGLLSLQIVLGVAGALGAAPAPLVVAHNLAAAMGLALLLGWTLVEARPPAA